MRDIERILSFWFKECSEKQWFGKDPDFDAAIRERFGAQVESAMSGELDHWCESADGTLAYLLLLDQFTRNIFRGSGRAFAADHSRGARPGWAAIASGSRPAMVARKSAL